MSHESSKETRAAFTELVDLAGERTGASVLYANDDFFASKDNLLKAAKPIFIEGKYTDRGKWMDGWESRRRRIPGHDHCIVRLGLPGIVRGVVVDTAFFRGNFPEHCSLEAAAVSGHPDVATLEGDGVKWTEILPKTALKGDTENMFAVAAPFRATHLRLHIYPDGGVARLRVYGDVLPDPGWLAEPGASVDLASVENGAVVLHANDMFFGSRHNLIMPGRGVNMGDGWETRRSRRAGPDWVVLRLGATGVLTRVVVETTHFKGNAPESCALQVTSLPNGASTVAADESALARPEQPWTPVLARTKLEPHARHVFTELELHEPATHVRFQIFPDGGVEPSSPLRSGRGCRAARERASGLERAHRQRARDPSFANSALSDAWTARMAAARPFASVESALRARRSRVARRSAPRVGRRLFRAIRASARRARRSRRLSGRRTKRRVSTASRKRCAPSFSPRSTRPTKRSSATCTWFARRERAPTSSSPSDAREWAIAPMKSWASRPTSIRRLRSCAFSGVLRGES